ncbi:MAG: phage holin family protein [Chloroflexi bacterium]|nr:MAG: phage holin family protein [Chloroflexota bacterium]
MRVPAVQSPSLYERPGYRTLLGRIRNNVRLYIRKQLELPRQEIAEIVRANLRAAMWFGVAFAFVLGTLIALTVLLIALVALVLPLWAAALVVLLLFIALAALTGYIGYRKLELRGPTRTINSLKETMRWAKSRLLGRSAS